MLHSSRPPPPYSSRPSPSSRFLARTLCPRHLAAQPAAGSATLAPAPAGIAPSQSAKQHGERGARQAVVLNPASPPASPGGAPGERAGQAPVDGPGSCRVCAAARGGPADGNTSIGRTLRRGAPTQTTPCGRAQGTRCAVRRRLTAAMCTWWAQPAGRRRRSLMGPQRHSTSATRRSYGGEMPPVVQAAAQPSIFPRRLAGREHVDELHREQRQHRARGARWATPRRQTRGIARAGREQGPSPSRSTASSGRRRCAAAASSGKAAAPEPSGGSSASAACPAAALRCRSRRLTEPLRQLAPRYRRPPPTLGHCRGRGERRARRCGAGSGFYSASGTISPIYGRS